MPRIPFQKPKKVEWEILSDQYGRLVSEPFEKGYAQTVGNSLRRTLLAVVPGAAASWVKIGGVRSGDERVAGVTESLTDMLLNLHKLAFHVPAGEARTVKFQVKGPRAVTGAEVPEDDLEVLNPEIHLFTIEGDTTVSIELGVEVGEGYESAEQKKGRIPDGSLPLDSAYSPIRRVSYNVEMSRLGKIIDYEKLVVEIWTNGAVSPDEALKRASAYLKDHFRPLSAAREDEEAEIEAPSDGEFLRDALAKPLEDLPLAARAINALKNADLNVVADVVQKTEADLEHVKNLGEKSIEELKVALASLGLSLGMRIDPTVLGSLARGGTR
jgi:DNA-directed RNA polymerase subunit alpha